MAIVTLNMTRNALRVAYDCDIQELCIFSGYQLQKQSHIFHLIYT